MVKKLEKMDGEIIRFSNYFPVNRIDSKIRCYEKNRYKRNIKQKSQKSRWGREVILFYRGNVYYNWVCLKPEE